MAHSGFRIAVIPEHPAGVIDRRCEPAARLIVVTPGLIAKLWYIVENAYCDPPGFGCEIAHMLTRGVF
jgi:hypothetical protein